MSTNQNNQNTISESQTNISELLKQYIWLWEHINNISDDDYLTTFTRLKQQDPNSLQVKGWIALSEAVRYTIKPQYGKPFPKILEAIDFFQQTNDKYGEGAALTMMIMAYKTIGQMDKAQTMAHKAVEYLGDYKPFIFFTQIAYYQIGEINYLLKDYDSAIRAFEMGLTFAKVDDANMNARLLNGIGNVYNAQNKFELAYDYFQRTLKLVSGKSNYLNESKIYADLGNYYFKQQDYENALNCQFKSIEIREKNNLTNPLLSNYIELAEIFLKQGNTKAALEYASLAEKKAIDLSLTIKQFEANLILSKIHEEMNEPLLALQRYKTFHKLSDEVLGQENTRKIKQLNVQHEIESMEKEKEIFKLRNVILKDALDEIGSSVRYAKRIQEAILPPISSIQLKFPSSFVLYQPKDIVAGDFYWFEEIDDTIFIAAADCTGHGVPGALVSVVCNNALNRAIKEFQLLDTGKILDKVCDLVCETFERGNEEVKDGMDISLLSINKVRKQINWSGANNPLWYFTGKNFNEITANKRPIGKSDNKDQFITHNIKFELDTTFFLFTDGYADQFGGDKGKKMMYKKFKETLETSINKESTAQKNILESNFNEWKGDLEQVDDVCVVGIKLD